MESFKIGDVVEYTGAQTANDSPWFRPLTKYTVDEVSPHSITATPVELAHQLSIISEYKVGSPKLFLSKSVVRIARSLFQDTLRSL